MRSTAERKARADEVKKRGALASEVGDEDL